MKTYRLFVLLFAITAYVFAQNPESSAWPPTAATDTELLVLSNIAQTTLNGAIDDTTLTVVLTSAAAFRTPTVIRIDNEFLKVCSKATNTMTVCSSGRGFLNTSGASHSNGATVSAYYVDYYNNRLAAEVKAIEGSAVYSSATFGTDNVLVRSDGTGRGAQSTGIVVDDSNNIALPGYAAITAITAPTTPGAGIGRVYVDSTSKNLAVKDDAGVVKHGMQTVSCTNQALTATTDAGGGTCTTLTSAYVNTSIAQTGVDINTSHQVTVTHLASALPVAQGGTGATTLTGPIKGNGASALSAAAAADIYGLWSGTCSSSTFLRGDGSCQTPGGSISGLTTSAIVTAASSTTIQTPNTSATMDSSGNISTPGTITSGASTTAGGSAVFGNATGDTAASFLEANSGDAASNGEPAYLKLWSSHATKRQASLFPCTNANGFLCIASATPAADASNIILTTDNTATLTNKTYDTAGSGNSFSINGVAATANTGAGAVARAISPSFTTPALGVATITSLNGLTVSTTTGTLTLANGSSIVTSGANSITLTSTGATNVTLPTSGTLLNNARSLTGGAGIAAIGDLSADRTIATASGETDFLASGALTCGAATQGRIQVHTTPLQYCDNAGTPALQYAAYGTSAGLATAGDSATAFFSTGNLEKAVQHAATVYNDASNTWSTGAQDFGSATSLKIPVAAGAAPNINGTIAYDSTNHMLHGAQTGEDALIPQFTITPTNNDCVKWVTSGSNYKLGTAAAPCGSGGSGGTAGSPLFTSTATVTVTATSETTLLGSGAGSLTIPANWFTAAGTSLVIESYGRLSTTTVPGTQRIQLKFGSSVMLDTGAYSLVGSITNAVYRLRTILTARTVGASGTIFAQSIFETTGAALVANEAKMLNTATVTIDTTATQVVDLTNLFDTASNSISQDVFTVYGPGSAVSSVFGQTGAVGNLSGDCATSGSSAVTCTQINGSNLTVNTSGVVTKYGGVNTAGMGVAAIIGVSNVTAQSTSQSTVTLATSPTAGSYRILYYAGLNTPCTTGANNVSFTFSWIDGGNARALTTGAMTLGAAQTTESYLNGLIPMYVASGNVTYTSTVSGACASGVSSYDIRASLEKL